MLAVRAARDKKQGRSAAWYLARPDEQSYCGLHNEGATCYLNSLLQALFVLEPVRRAVYAFEYSGEAVHGPAEACVPLQLAKLFARMQLSSCHAASTTDLTASFGWSRAESFRQHDVQELCRVLFTALGKYGVDLEAKLLEGTLTSTLRCLTCGHRSTRDEAFCDVSLDVGSSSSLEEALEGGSSSEAAYDMVIEPAGDAARRQPASGSTSAEHKEGRVEDNVRGPFISGGDVG